VVVDAASGLAVATVGLGESGRHGGPLAWSPDGRILGRTAEGGEIHIIELGTLSLAARSRAGEPERGALALAFSPDGARLASAGGDATVRVREVARPDAVRVLTGHESTVLSLAWSRDGRFLASAGFDAEIRLWHGDTLEPAGTLRMDEHATVDTGTSAIALSPDGTRLLACGRAQACRLFRVADGAVLAEWRGWAAGIDWSPDGSRIAIGAGQVLHVRDTRDFALPAAFRGHESAVTAAALSPAGDAVASGEERGLVLVWDLATGEPRRRFPAHEGRVRAVGFSPDGALVATSGEDGAGRVLDLASGEAVPLEPGVDPNYGAFAFSPDGRHLATDRAVCDARTGKVLRWFAAGGNVEHVEWSPDGSRIVLSGWFRRSASPAVVLDAATGKAVLAVPDLARRHPWFRFGPDGTTLIGYDGTGVVTLNATDGVPVASRAVTTQKGYSPVAWSGDLARILRPDLNSLDLATGAITPPPAVAKGPHRPPTALALSRDGKHAVAGYGTGLLRLLDLP
jgi:WD40 repeat protein